MDQTSKELDTLLKTFFDECVWSNRLACSVDSLDYVLAIQAFFHWCAMRRIMQDGPRNVVVTDFTQGDVLQYMDEYAVTPALHVDDYTERPIELRLVLLGLNDFGAWLLKAAHLRCNPFAGIPIPKPARRRVRTVAV